MERRYQVAGPVRVGAAAQAADAFGRAEQQLGGEVAQRHDDSWVDELELFVEVGPAGLDLVGEGIAVARRAALDGIGDIEVISSEAHLLQDQAVQELARPAHEGQALAVLLLTGPSPTNMRSAVGFPIPNTTFVRVAARRQRVHVDASSATGDNSATAARSWPSPTRRG